MKKVLFLTLSFMALGFQAAQASDNSGPENRHSITPKATTMAHKNKASAVIKELGRCLHDCALLYASLMINSAAHEYGHAMTGYLFNQQCHIVINRTNGERYGTGKDVIFDYIKKKLDGQGGNASFPTIKINLRPSSDSTTFMNGRSLTPYEDIAIYLAGPLAGMGAIYLTHHLFPTPYSAKSKLSEKLWAEACNLIPTTGSDGYLVLKSLGFSLDNYISQSYFDGVISLLSTLNIARHVIKKYIVGPYVKEHMKAFLY